MRAHKKQLIEWTLLIVFWLTVIPGWSQEETPFAEENTYITVSGVVKDKQNRKTLEYVNVSVPGTSVGTVTNADGEFSWRCSPKGAEQPTKQPKALLFFSRTAPPFILKFVGFKDLPYPSCQYVE